ncbi:hypothetical protein FRC03_005697 [Tulasnella sp. 419]|nr:hypothetical protein FRC03_005697 [Tulasnella sp. 419]
MSDTKRAETHVRNPNEVSRTTKRNTREPGSNLSKEKSSDVIPASHIKNGRLQSGASSPKSSSLASFAPQAFEPGPAHRNHLISVPLSPHRTELMKKSSVHTPLIVDMATVLSGSKILSNNQDTRRPESEVKPNHLSRPT